MDSDATKMRALLDKQESLSTEELYQLLELQHKTRDAQLRQQWRHELGPSKCYQIGDPNDPYLLGKELVNLTKMSGRELTDRAVHALRQQDFDLADECNVRGDSETL